MEINTMSEGFHWNGIALLVTLLDLQLNKMDRLHSSTRECNVLSNAFIPKVCSIAYEL